MKPISKSDIDEKFGKVLREFRIKKGLTQEQLSEKLGISLKYISRIENGNNGIKTQTLIKYINILGFTPNTIYKDFIENKDVKYDIELAETICSLPKGKKEFIKNILPALVDFEPDDKNNEDINKEK